MAQVRKPLVLMILDGFGLRHAENGNAIAHHAPNISALIDKYPFTTLEASGEAVGLPEGQMGNSEVGHLNIGAGRVVYQELTRITKAIRDKSFFQNQVLQGAMETAKANGGALHLIGLLSDGGVHSHIEHLFALIDFAKMQGLKEVYIHALLDGRDVPPANAREYIEALEEKLKTTELGKIATVMGRYYAMDRDKRWERVEKAYQAMVDGEGLKVTLPVAAVAEAYDREETDEFVTPTVVVDENMNPIGKVKSGDSIIFFNFRPDRAREITRAFVDEEFEGFQRKSEKLKIHYVCMTQYDKTIEASVAFKPQTLENTLGEVLSAHGLQQLRLAETEKYAHVTFFFNGGVEQPCEGEERCLIPSPKVATYDLKPEMSACEVTENFITKLESGNFDVIIINYANPDMVGHTGVMEAAEKAVAVVDDCAKKAIEAVLAKGGQVLVTADHGNAEKMMDENGQPFTAHTTSKVPFILVNPDFVGQELKAGGQLEDVAPTILDLLGVPKPEEMTGESLINN